MDGIDMKRPSCLTEDTIRTQRVEVYLSDLKQRLKNLRVKHDEVIKNSVEIIRELDDVSQTVLSKNDEVDTSNTPVKIKKLIKDFETIKESGSVSDRSSTRVGTGVNIQKILQNFEKLNDSQVLKESLNYFKRAKETFDKIDSFMDVLNPSAETKSTSTCASTPSKLKEKINLFNSGFKIGDSDKSPTRYASCCSSAGTLQTFHSSEDIESRHNSDAAYKNAIEVGYEGDNDDSEYDLRAALAKRKGGPRNSST